MSYFVICPTVHVAVGEITRWRTDPRHPWQAEVITNADSAKNKIPTCPFWCAVHEAAFPSLMLPSNGRLATH